MTKATNNGPGGGTKTKWLVIGAILVVLAIVFKKPLSEMMNRNTNVQTSLKGEKIITVQTDIGDLKVSQEKVKTQEVAKSETDGDVKTYVSNYHYVMTWPKGDWRIDGEELQKLKTAFTKPGYAVDMVCLRKHPSQSGFTPNVNVIISPADAAHSITRQMDLFKDMITKANGHVIDDRIDLVSQGAILTYTAEFDGKKLYYIQRFVNSDGKIYTITATTIFNDDAQTKSELLGILNSFKIVEG